MRNGLIPIYDKRERKTSTNLIKTRETAGNLREFGDDCEPALLPSQGDNSKKRLT